MFAPLLLSAALSPGQPPPDVPPEPLPAFGEVAPPEPPRSLFAKAVQGSPLGDFLTANRTAVSGFVDARYTGATVSRLSNIPYGMGLSYNRDVPQRVWATVERSVDKEAYDPTWGFRVDLLAGSAYQYTMQRGLLTYQLRDKDGQPNRIGFDPIQFYADFYIPGENAVQVKIGRSFNRIGYESLDASRTVLPSYSYARSFAPFTQTGLFTETRLNDEWLMQHDFLIGNDVWFESAARFYYWGGMRYTSCETCSTFQAGVLLGHGRYDVGSNFHNPQLVNAVFTHPFGDKLTYAFELLYGWQRDVPNVGFAEFYSFANYLTYQIDAKWSSTLRVEFFDDIDGTRTGFKGFYGSYTWGLAWKPCDAVLIRPELRYDRCNNNRPFDGRKELFGAMINAIVLW